MADDDLVKLNMQQRHHALAAEAIFDGKPRGVSEAKSSPKPATAKKPARKAAAKKSRS